MADLAARGPLGLKDRDKPKQPKTRKPVRKVSKTRQARKASAEGQAGRDHMARVAALPCICCGYWPVEVHHVISDRYGQRKAADTETIPLCYNHHRGPDGIHTDKARWEATFGKDYSFLPIDG